MEPTSSSKSISEMPFTAYEWQKAKNTKPPSELDMDFTNF